MVQDSLVHGLFTVEEAFRRIAEPGADLLRRALPGVV
jgi:hypothetical protein